MTLTLSVSGNMSGSIQYSGNNASLVILVSCRVGHQNLPGGCVNITLPILILETDNIVWIKRNIVKLDRNYGDCIFTTRAKNIMAKKIKNTEIRGRIHELFQGVRNCVIDIKSIADLLPKATTLDAL